MTWQPLSDEDAQAVADADVTFGGNASRAAASLDLDRSTYRHRLKIAAKRGLLGTSTVPLPGFEITQTSVRLDKNGDVAGQTITQRPELDDQAFEMPTGHRIKGVSALLDGAGNVRAKWVKTREDDFDPEALVEWIKAAFDGWPVGNVGPRPERPNATDEELAVLYPLADWHLGLYTWAPEVGDNWDLKLAEAKLGEAMLGLIARTPRSHVGIVLGGGDMLHSDNEDNRTRHSGNALDVDGRYQKVVGVACRLLVRTVDAALGVHEHVVVRMLKGNHDEHSAVALAYFLSAWYRDEPRVTVDLDPSLFWWFRFGKVMLGATHGHTVKIKEMPGIMAHRRAEDWGKTRHRYVHGFHLHHTEKLSTEGHGCISEIHQAPIPQDAWHFGSGYLAGRSMSSITYHKDDGEIGRSRVVVR